MIGSYSTVGIVKRRHAPSVYSSSSFETGAGRAAARDLQGATSTPDPTPSTSFPNPQTLNTAEVVKKIDENPFQPLSKLEIQMGDIIVLERWGPKG